jgi:tetratricopeptide (TPR) repeat protein
MAEAELWDPVGGSMQIHGVLTHALFTELHSSDPKGLTYAQLAQAFSEDLKWLQPFVVGKDLDEKVFSNPLKEGKADELLTQRIIQQPIRQTIPLLRRLIEQRNGIDPEGHLNLGIAHAALGDYDKGIDALKKAIEQQSEQDYPEARYHLGRVLYESERDLDRAASELRDSIKKEPDNAAAHYYLGQAIRARVQREVLVEAKDALQAYLDKGAPLGQREQVRELLSSMRDATIGTGDGGGNRLGTG